MKETATGASNEFIERDISLPRSGVQIHAEVSGCSQGQPLVLMHGWGCDHSTVRMIARIAAEEGFRVWNIDFPGFGESPEPPEVWGVEAYSDAIAELMKREGISDPVLVGHSFGGRVGIFLSSRPEIKVAKLVLVDSAGIKPRRGLKYRWRVGSFKAQKALLRMVLGERRAKRYIDRMRAKRGSADYAAASDKMRMVMSRVVNEDLTSRLPAIKAPTLLIWGANDTATPVADAKLMEREIPDAGLVVFDDAGHFSFLDQPGRFSAVFRSFLKS